MIEQSIYILTCMILGFMVFFSFVVAPSTFKLLNEKNSRIFIRGIFPLYYLLNLTISLIVVFLISYLGDFSLDFYLMLLICSLFLVSNFILMPLINKFKDSGKEKKFKISHFISVAINFVQMIFLVLIIT
mgnify:CR=1 FL=1|tara:strand:+ start:2819 stop:3208 length:390 start_codon:yes stop_codon:yes gene_type:complete